MPRSANLVICRNQGSQKGSEVVFCGRNVDLDSACTVWHPDCPPFAVPRFDACPELLPRRGANIPAQGKRSAALGIQGPSDPALKGRNTRSFALSGLRVCEFPHPGRRCACPGLICPGPFGAAEAAKPGERPACRPGRLLHRPPYGAGGLRITILAACQRARLASRCWSGSPGRAFTRRAPPKGFQLTACALSSSSKLLGTIPSCRLRRKPANFVKNR